MLSNQREDVILNAVVYNRIDMGYTVYVSDWTGFVCVREKVGEGGGISVLVGTNTTGANKVVTSKSSKIKALRARFSRLAQGRLNNK